MVDTLNKSLTNAKKSFRCINDKFSIGERGFAYELYHQIRMELNRSNHNHRNNREGHAEIPKQVITDDNKQYLFYPDLIIHGGINNFDPNNQLLAAEIKILNKCSKIKILKDLNKLYIYLTQFRYNQQLLNFKYTAMILLNCNKDEFLRYMREISLNRFTKNKNAAEEYLRNLNKLNYSEKRQNFLLFTVPKNEEEINQFTLADLLEECPNLLIN